VQAGTLFADAASLAAGDPGGARAAPCAAAPRHAESRRILLAEDNAANHAVIRRLLEQRGYSVDIAANGIEAVSMASRLPYRVILMDILMPEMDGIEATRRIRGLSGPHGRTPIIALSSGIQEQDRARLSEAGIDDILIKPIDVPGLEAALERHRAS
jgi:CheY-like chemotaxis protein